MTTKPLVTISYWAYPLNDGKMIDLEGIDDFESELSKNFNLFISGKPSDALGGGLYEMIMTVYHNENIHDLIVFGSGMVSEAAKDIIKDTVKEVLVKYIANPIKDAFSIIKERDKDKEPDIDQINIKFKDIDISIYNVHVDGIAKNINIIMDVLSSRVQSFILDNQLPYQIFIPIFKDREAESQDWKQKPVFRTLQKIDEPIQNVTSDAYFDYWGLFYTTQEDQFKAYNVRTYEMTNIDFTMPETGSY
ncbi:hypothetical protein [Hymenobacter fodinae]|uniref:Uncharacterized protein n=1 Tax=Hymenobacter fodinae TaxID=2510796 RepID=A0A4Z0NZV3_9BACT|nr:hypothetical protein [Hymenobacter fodinae]TGE04534.1 hypothetical protein EU556_20315 [Hymenobacter fodinae]